MNIINCVAGTQMGIHHFLQEMGFQFLQAKATLWVNRLKTLEGPIFRGNNTEMEGMKPGRSD
jgi:hypothetical protein